MQAKGQVMTMKIISIGISVLMAVLLGGCAKTEGDSDNSERTKDATTRLKEGTAQALSSLGDLASLSKEDVQKRMDKELESLQENLTKLKSKATSATAEAKAAYEKEIPALEEKTRKLRENLADMKTRSGKAWDDMATATVSAMGELKKGYDAAKTHFD